MKIEVEVSEELYAAILGEVESMRLRVASDATLHDAVIYLIKKGLYTP